MNNKPPTRLVRLSSTILAVGLLLLLAVIYAPRVLGSEGRDHVEPDSQQGAIVVHLNPDRDDAQITAVRVSGDRDYLNGGNAPVADQYTEFVRDGDAYVKNNVNIEAWCFDTTNFVSEYVQFDVSATAGNIQYETRRVELDCGEVSEVTLDGSRNPDDSDPNNVTLRFNYPNCNEGDRLEPVPRIALVEIDGVGSDFSYREDGAYGLFTFQDVPPGIYVYNVAYLDSEGQASAQRGYTYFYQGRIAVNGEDPARVRETLIGRPVNLYTDETPACDFDNDLPELPPLDDFAEPTCTEAFPAVISWAICAALDWVDGAVNRLLETLNNLLSVDRSEFETTEMRKAWSYFRNIASLLLVVIGLIMIIGQAVSKE